MANHPLPEIREDILFNLQTQLIFKIILLAFRGILGGWSEIPFWIVEGPCGCQCMSESRGNVVIA
jgi:hypothetical protein